MLRSVVRRLGSALVFVEHNPVTKKISPSTLSAISAASKFGPVTAIAPGKDHDAVVSAISQCKGVEKVISVSAPEYEHLNAENVAKLIEAHSKGFSHIVAAHSTIGKSILPRVAAKLDKAMLTDVLEIKGENTFVRPIYAGNALITVKTKDTPVILTIRPTVFEKAASGGKAEVVKGESAGETGLSKWVSDEQSQSDKPDLTTARVVISGGRGLKNGENFKMLYDLADKIGNCAVGATRAVVDAGYVGSDLQVGQTGKTVAPELYIAAGLSGAIQHVAGMKDSKVIVSINTDPEAPIASISDYVLQQDLFEAIPELTKKISDSK